MSEPELRDEIVELILARELIEPQALTACLSEQSASGRSLAEVLVERGLLTAEAFGALAEEALFSGATEMMPQAQTLPPGDGQREGGELSAGLDRYELVREIGQGGMGTVYEATDKALGRQVALKLLKRSPGDRAMVERFHREARVSAKLKHPNIIVVHEVGEAHIAMEFVDGRTLEEAQLVGGLGRSEELRILTRVAEAVGHAHQQGVIHRDLKPANILLTKDGRPIVTDFGLARDVSDTRMTATGQVMGTLYYMAPEQVQGEVDRMGPPTDVWALGVMLYEMLTGELPFSGQTVAEISPRIVQQQPAAPDGPAELVAICLMALRKEPGERYADAVALADDLRRQQSGAPILARPPSVLSRLSFRLRRHPWVVLALLLLLIGFSTAGAVMGARHFREAEQRQRLSDLRASAEAAYRAKNWSLALVLCEQGTALAPDSRLAEIMRGCRSGLAAAERRRNRLARRQQMQAEMAVIRQRMVELRPAWYIARVDLAPMLGRLRVDLQRLTQLSADPMLADDASAAALLGAGWYFLSDLGRAQAALRRALALDPSSDRLKRMLSRVYMDYALRYLQIERAPKLMARSYLKLAAGLVGRPDDSRQATTIEQQLQKVYWSFTNRKSPGDLRRHCQDGIRLFAGQLGIEEFWMFLASVETRERCLTEALKVRPHYPRALFYRGWGRRDRGDRAGALADFSRAIALNPADTFSLNDRAGMLRAAGDLAGALHDLTAAIRADPRFALSYDNRGHIYKQQRKYAAAIRDYSHAIRLQRGYVSALFNRGLAFKAQGKLAHAIADYSRAIRFDGRHVGAYRCRAYARMDQGQTRQAIQDYLQAIALEPQGALTHFNLGLARAKLGQLRAAIEDYGRAIRLDPKLARAVQKRAFARASTGDLDGAIDDYTRLLALSPGAVGAHYNRGYARYLKQQFEAAIADFTAAIGGNPRHLLAYKTRGLAWLALRQRARAAGDFERALALARKPAQRVELAKLLERSRANR